MQVSRQGDGGKTTSSPASSADWSQGASRIHTLLKTNIRFPSNCVWKSLFSYGHTYIHTYVHTYIYIIIYIHTYICIWLYYTYIYIQNSVLSTISICNDYRIPTSHPCQPGQPGLPFSGQVALQSSNLSLPGVSNHQTRRFNDDLITKHGSTIVNSDITGKILM